MSYYFYYQWPYSMEQLPLEVTLIFESKNLKSNLTIDLLSRGNNPKTIKYQSFLVKRLDCQNTNMVLGINIKINVCTGKNKS